MKGTTSTGSDSKKEMEEEKVIVRHRYYEANDQMEREMYAWDNSP